MGIKSEDTSPQMTAASSTASPGRPSVESLKMVIAGLKGSADWHAEQGRPYSETVDRDAIAFITRLASERTELLEALKSIAEYWNRDANESAMANACWHAIGTAEDAITKATVGSSAPRVPGSMHTNPSASPASPSPKEER